MTTLLRFPETCKRCGLGRTTIYERVREGLFPSPVSIGKRLVAFPESDVEALNEALVRGANEYEIRALVKSLHAKRGGAQSTTTSIKSHLPKIAKERSKERG